MTVAGGASCAVETIELMDSKSAVKTDFLNILFLLLIFDVNIHLREWKMNTLVWYGFIDFFI